MKSFAVFIICFVSGTCLADDKTNKYMDNFLSTAFAGEVRHLDIGKVVASDFEVKFESKLKVFGKVNGKARFENGRVEGLDAASRQSECQTGQEWAGKSINCTVSFAKLRVKYDAKLKYGKLPKVGIKGEAKISEIRFFLKIVGGKVPMLANFKCIQKGSISKVEFKGLGPLNRFLKVMEDGYKQHVTSVVFGAITEKLQYAINRALSKDAAHFVLLR